MCEAGGSHICIDAIPPKLVASNGQVISDPAPPVLEANGG